MAAPGSASLSGGASPRPDYEAGLAWRQLDDPWGDLPSRNYVPQPEEPQPPAWHGEEWRT